MTTEPKPGLTPSQTIGPFFAYALTPRAYRGGDLVGDDLTVEGVAGERIAITGRVLDGDGEPVTDAMLEIWQADAAGTFRQQGDNAGFRGFGRAETDAEGGYRFVTIRPGPVTGQAPHLTVSVFARGLLNRLATRIYFADEAGNAADPVLALVPAERRATLIAERESGGPARFRHDIRLQGEGETVFFDV